RTDCLRRKDAPAWQGTRRMSALGQKRTCAAQNGMSAPESGRWLAPSSAILTLQVRSLDAQHRLKSAIRLSKKDWLLHADRAVLCRVSGAGCASGSCPAGLFAEVGLRWWRRWSPHK